MKRRILLFALPAFALASCTKPKPESRIYTVGDTTPVTVNTPDTSFYVSGLASLTTFPLAQTTLPISVVHTDGIQRNVSLSVADLPENVKVKLSHFQGYTPFSSVISIDSRFATPGKYPIKVLAIPDTGKVKEYGLTLQIDTMSEKDCLFQVFGRMGQPAIFDMSGSRVGNLTAIFEYSTINLKSYVRSLLLSYGTSQYDSYISYHGQNNLDGLIDMEVNCTNGQITIPTQTVKGIRTLPGDTLEFTISGNGQIDPENNTYDVTYITDSATYRMHGTFYY